MGEKLIICTGRRHWFTHCIDWTLTIVWLSWNQVSRKWETLMILQTIQGLLGSILTILWLAVDKNIENIFMLRCNVQSMTKPLFQRYLSTDVQTGVAAELLNQKVLFLQFGSLGNFSERQMLMLMWLQWRIIHCEDKGHWKGYFQRASLGCLP